MDSPLNLGSIFTARLGVYGESVALIEVRSERPRSRTYLELESNASRVAAFLAESGAQPGDAAAMIVGNQLEYLESLLGASRAGLAVVPINVRAGNQRIIDICQDCRPKVLFADSLTDPGLLEYLSNFLPVVRVVIGGRRERWTAYQDIMTSFSGAQVVCKANPTGAAMYVYTSGSSGKSKGVVISHQSALQPILDSPSYRSKEPSPQRTLLATPITHEAAFSSVKEMLGFGGSAVLLDQFRPVVFLELLSKLRCTLTKIVPSMAISILSELASIEALDFSRLQMIVIGGAPSDKSLLSGLQRAFPKSLILQYYGMTECGNVFIRKAHCGKRPPVDSLGIPAARVEVKIGSENKGNVGELFVRTPTMMTGYLGGVESTRLHEGWLRTGDLFSRDDDGFYYFRGRADDMFVCAGENVFPLEIENILNSHPDVEMSCVCSTPDLARGQVPIAFIQKRVGSLLTEGELCRFYDKSGPLFARPDKFYFLTSFPLNATGKIDRLALRGVATAVR